MPVLSPVVLQGSANHRDPSSKLIRLERPAQDPDADAPREFKLYERIRHLHAQDSFAQGPYV